VLTANNEGVALGSSEVSYVIETRLGWEAEDLSARNFTAAPILPGDWMRIVELTICLLGPFDSSVVVLVEDHAQVVVTLDRRHFTVVRPNHVRAFALLA
jgi:hypothetical protein